MKNCLYTLSIGFLLIQLSQSCKSVYPNVMFKDIDSASINNTLSRLEEDYKIKPGDELNIKVFTADGSQLVDPRAPQIIESGGGTSGQMFQNFYFLVSNAGYIDLPLIGKLKVDNLNEKQLLELLNQKYTQYYQKPHVALRVENRRAFLFKGSIGQLVSLNRTPTNLFEVLAKSGGFDRNYHADRIIIIRGNLRNPDIHTVNLSTMEGIKNSELMIQSNDIIYVEERRRPLFHTINELAPIVSLPLAILTSTLSTILIIITISNK